MSIFSVVDTALGALIEHKQKIGPFSTCLLRRVVHDLMIEQQNYKSLCSVSYICFKNNHGTVFVWFPVIQWKSVIHKEMAEFVTAVVFP